MAILILFILVIISIGVAYYYDYKQDKKYFKKSIFNVFVLIIIVLTIIFSSEIINLFKTKCI
jgi:hypothetical protein